MNSQPQVTVIMPVHNGAAYLRDTMDSILGQTFTDFEFLIVNDNSTDESVAIVNSFQDQRIRLVNALQRLKLAGALNLGMHEARGDLLARMDADDIALPDRLQHQVRFLQGHPDIGICGSWIKKFPDVHDCIGRYPLSPEEVHAFSLFHSPFAHPSVMMRRSCFTRHDLWYDVSYYPTEDFDLWCRALTRFPGANIAQVLLHYRIHQQSLTQSDWNTMDEQAAIITRRGLEALGMDSDITAARQHRRIAMVQIERSLEELLKAHAWLYRIINRNRQACVYPHHALQGVAEDLWFRLCMHCARAVPSAPFHYLRHRFATSPTGFGGRLALVLASSLKHQMSNRGV